VGEKSEWFEDSWRYREEVLYPAEFGGKSNGLIDTIPYEAFAQIGFKHVDPRWLHCGVVAFAPIAKRQSYTFVTSGLSNAWDADGPDSTSISGLGIELRIETMSNEHWAKDVLLRLSATQLLIAAGRMTGARLLSSGDRIRVGAENFGNRSAMTSLLVTKVADLKLPSGTFEMLQLVAITDAEGELAKSQSAEALVALLRDKTGYPISDVGRSSLV
jgi:hypothetical protein